MKFAESFVDVKDKLKSIFSKNKKIFILVSVLVFMIIVSLFLYPTKNSSDNNQSVEEKDIAINVSSYSDMIESKIKKMLLGVSEITKAEVMVVCESTEVYEYLMNRDETKNENGSSTIREEVAFEKEGSNTSPILITSKMPKVLAVWIVINEVSPSTKLAITNSIESVLNISKDCISILQER